jgi:hypothetical protein
MKKLLIIIVLGLLLSGNSYASKIGKGNIQFNDEVTKNFIRFLRNEYSVSFVVTPDGSYSTYGICGVERCKGGMTTVLKWCKKDTGQKCYVFAQRKKQQKIIRWNKADYIFPKDDWNYNATVKTESLSTNNKGIKQNISDDQIKSVLNELGFINFNKAVASIASDSSKMKTKNSKKGGEYFCVWTGIGEYTHKIWFSHSSDVIKWKKIYGGKGNDDCRNSALTSKYSSSLYIIYKEENKKLHSKLLWKYKTYESGFYPAYKLSKKLFAQVKEQVPVNVIELKEEVEQSIVTNEASVVPKEEKKMTKQQQIEIDQIKEMFDIGALTKEEYDNAIKRALN